jgi:hypothetical protein
VFLSPCVLSTLCGSGLLIGPLVTGAAWPGYWGRYQSNIIYFNFACATLICVNQNKHNGSHNTPLKELGRDQFSQLRFLRPRIRKVYRSLILLETMLCLYIVLSS